MLQSIRSLVRGVLADSVVCPRCTSEDVRPSRRPFALARLGLLRWRCRACDHYFLLRGAAVQAARARVPVPPAEGVGPRDGSVDFEPLDRLIAQIRQRE